jgi:hypothetical protein
MGFHDALNFIMSPLEGCPKDGVDVFFYKPSIPSGFHNALNFIPSIGGVARNDGVDAFLLIFHPFGIQ